MKASSCLKLVFGLNTLWWWSIYEFTHVWNVKDKYCPVLTLQCVSLCSANTAALGHNSSQMLHLCLLPPPEFDPGPFAPGTPVVLVVEEPTWPACVFMWFSSSVRVLHTSLQYAHWRDTFTEEDFDDFTFILFEILLPPFNGRPDEDFLFNQRKK